MFSNQQFILQREQLVALRGFLQQFDAEMQQKVAEYKRRIGGLREAGLPQETMNKFFSEMLPEIESHIRRDSDYIQNTAIPFVNKNIEALERLIEINR
jgi:hypothetical protein